MIEPVQLIKRLVMSVVLLTVAGYAIYFAPNWFFLLILEGFILIAMWEYFDLAEKTGLVINRYLGLVFAGLLPLAYYTAAESLIIVIAILTIFIFNFHRRLRDQALANTAITLFGILYVAWALSFMAKIKWLDHGAEWITYTILVVKMGDAGAYFVGKQFGRNKFAAHISPNKSVEGAVGGFAVSVLLSLASRVYLHHVPLVYLLLLGVVVGILAQLGDLAESLIKRTVNVKDSGNWPGLGGMLDVLDSLLFATPAVYYFIQVFQS